MNQALRQTTTNPMVKAKSRQAQDKDLIREFIGGDDHCFELLLDRHKSKVFTTIYLIVKDRSQAEDLFQDVMIKVVRMIRSGKYNEEGKFLPWAVRIARNLAIDHFRKQQRNPLVHDNDTFDVFGPSAHLDTHSEDRIIREENVRYVKRLIQQLPDKQREVLVMRNYADMSFREIAEMTDVSINTALGRMRYALINLRKLASAEPIPDEKKQKTPRA